MNYSQIIHELENASTFDLWRLQIAINKMIDDPKRQLEIKSQLEQGKIIQYFEPDENRLIDAEIIEIRRTKIYVRNIHDARYWTIPLYMINIGRVDTNIVVNRDTGKFDRNSLKVGDHVGWFSTRSNQEMYGKVIKLNPKKARVEVDELNIWTVPYSILFPVIDGDRANDSMLIELNPTESF